jgi:hypothetical protein
MPATELRQRADSHSVFGGDRRDDALQPLDRISPGLNARLRQGLGVAVEHNLAGKLACGNFLIRLRRSAEVSSASITSSVSASGRWPA